MHAHSSRQMQIGMDRRNRWAVSLGWLRHGNPLANRVCGQRRTPTSASDSAIAHASEQSALKRGDIKSTNHDR